MTSRDSRVLQDRAHEAALRAVAVMDGRTVATAESLTAGLVCATLGTIPGVSAILRGGVVAYCQDVKVGVLGVERTLLESGGAVQEEVARAMAAGACRLLGARFAVATTGVAGPGPTGGHPPGTVWLCAADSAGATSTRRLALPGARDDVRWGATAAALELLAELAEQIDGAGR